MYRQAFGAGSCVGDTAGGQEVYLCGSEGRASGRADVGIHRCEISAKVPWVSSELKELIICVSLVWSSLFYEDAWTVSSVIDDKVPRYFSRSPKLS